MSTPIQSNSPILRPYELVESGLPLRQEEGSFAEMFSRAINDASSLQEDAQVMIKAFLRGEAVDIHQVMAASAEAGISLQLLVEIRNKLTEAYRSVMQMQ
jgi:flagellar hook-basal body complex protein FliE